MAGRLAMTRGPLGVEGHHGAFQVHRSRQLGEMAGLVVLDIDLEVVQQPPACWATPSRRTRVPSARRAPREVSQLLSNIELYGHQVIPRVRDLLS